MKFGSFVELSVLNPTINLKSINSKSKTLKQSINTLRKSGLNGN